MRLEALAKGGYYPTPDIVVDQMAQMLDPASLGEPSGSELRLLDPCCGEGDAAARLLSALRASCDTNLNARCWGIELNRERAAAARTKLDFTLRADAFGTQVARGAFTLLYLNPPYDTDRDSRRLEHRFLTRWTPHLVPGSGVLAYIAPRRSLAVSAEYLATHYSDFRYWTFPSPERERFDQIVLLAKRKPAPSYMLHYEEDIRRFAGSDAPMSPPFGETVALDGLAAGGYVMFRRLGMDVGQAMREAGELGLTTRDAFTDLVRPTAHSRRRSPPLTPLREGHIVQLIAAGLLNNMVLEGGAPGVPDVLVKGMERRETVRRPSGKDTTIVSERSVTTIVTLDLDSWEFTEVR